MKKPATRLVEVFVHMERRVGILDPKTHWTTGTRIVREPGWKVVKFAKLKKGDIFRLWDYDSKGKKVPDQIIRGYHAVQIALEDAKRMKDPMIGVVKCLPVRNFWCSA